MKKILSVDDEPAMLRVISDVLKLKGYQLFTTSNASEALEIIKRENIALVLLDVKMPRKNGFEIYTEMRAVRKIPALFVTAYPDSFTTDSDYVKEMWEKHFSDGDTDIIYKPFDIKTLCEKVENLIGTASE